MASSCDSQYICPGKSPFPRLHPSLLGGVNHAGDVDSRVCSWSSYIYYSHPSKVRVRSVNLQVYMYVVDEKMKEKWS